MNMKADEFYEHWRRSVVYHRVGQGTTQLEFKPEEAFQFAEAYAALKTAQMVVGRDMKDEHDALIVCFNLVYNTCKDWEEKCRDQKLRIEALEESGRGIMSQLTRGQTEIAGLQQQLLNSRQRCSELEQREAALERKLEGRRKRRK